MNLKALRQRAADLVRDMKAKQAAMGATDLTPEQRAALRQEFQALEAAADLNAEDLKAAERLAEREKALTPIVDQDHAAGQRAASHITVTDRSDADTKRGFSNVADFARSVRSAFTPGGRVDTRLAGGIVAAPTNYHSEAGSAGEGYEVPAEFRDQIYQLAFPGNDLVSALNPEPTDKGSVEIEADETTPWGATGVQAAWRGEGTQLSASKSESKLRTVRLQELYAFVLATEELLSDAPRLQNRLTVKAAQAIRYKASDAVINGTGTGQPLGWMKSGALVTITKETSQAAATINATNVLKMYARLIAEGGSPFWVAHSSTLPQLATMTIGNQPIFTAPNQGMKDAPGGLLLGLPIRYVEQAETVGTKGDLQLVNPAGYYSAVKRGESIQFASSIHLYFDYNMQAFRWTFRMAGQPFLSAPMSRAKGSETKSHFVVIETRS